jgi:hypothetical protein
LPADKLRVKSSFGQEKNKPEAEMRRNRGATNRLQSAIHAFQAPAAVIGWFVRVSQIEK